MKNTSFKFLSLTIIAVILSSCATMKINYSGKKLDKVQNIVLISTMIGKIQLPLFPLIDAAAFNTKPNGIADKIMDIQKQNIDKFRETLAFSLKKNFNCNVLYANALQNATGYAEVKANYDFQNSLLINDEHYPLITLASNDINPFKFENGVVTSYFTNIANYKPAISAICKKLEADLIAFSYSNLTVVGVGAFGVVGYLRLDTYLYLFDKDGDLISDAHTWSSPISTRGKEVNDYKVQLDNLPLIMEPMMNKVVLNFQGK